MADEESTLLDLSTQDFERSNIRIDGTLYALRSPHELRLPQVKRVNAVSSRLSKMQMDDDPEQAIDELDSALNEVLSILMVDLPDEVRDQLSFSHKTAILQAFSGLVAEEAAGDPTSTPSQSPGSNDSTEAA